DPRTRSEAAVTLAIEGQAIGIVNFESFDEGGFDGYDAQPLQLLAEAVAVAVQTATKQTPRPVLKKADSEPAVRAICAIPSKIENLAEPAVREFIRVSIQ